MNGLSLSISEANRLVMVKNHLLRQSGKGSVVGVADDLCGLHATSSITPYLSLFNRIDGFSPEDLNLELGLKKLQRVRAMRGTLFLVSREMFPVVAMATRASEDKIDRALLRWHISNQEFQTVSKAILSTLNQNSKTIVEIKRDVPRKFSRTIARKTGWRVMKRTKVDEVLNLLVVQGRLQSQAEPLVWNDVKWDGYGLRFFSAIRKITYSPSQTGPYDTLDTSAKTKLVELYIKRYGPVAIDDIAWWMDLSIKIVANIVEGISDRLVKIRIKGLGQEFLLHEQELDTLQNLDREDSSVHFLPFEDPYAKGIKLRQRLIDHDFEGIAYPTGGALPTVLVDGRIVGTWSIIITDHVLRLVIRRFIPLGRIAIERVREEGQRLARFLTREIPTEVIIEGEKRWRQIVAASRPSFYVTGTPRQEKSSAKGSCWRVDCRNASSSPT